MSKYMVIGAHPDDCEAVAGIMLKLLDLGHSVKFLSATNGCSGHQTQMGGALAVRRRAEADKVAEIAGIEYDFLDIDNGFLTTDLPARKLMMRAIREYDPDVIITHRPQDYHPDHRNTGILVQDCSFLVQVPNVCPLTPVMSRMPAIFYMQDSFKKPYPFEPHLVFDIDSTVERKMLLFHQYASQMYEWLPWVAHDVDPDMPGADDDAGRLEWLKRTRMPQYADDANEIRDKLVEKYGEHGREVRYAEALEMCEYGAQPDRGALEKLFPF